MEDCLSLHLTWSMTKKKTRGGDLDFGIYIFESGTDAMSGRAISAMKNRGPAHDSRDSNDGGEFGIFSEALNVGLFG